MLLLLLLLLLLSLLLLRLIQFIHLILFHAEQEVSKINNVHVCYIHVYISHSLFRVDQPFTISLI